MLFAIPSVTQELDGLRDGIIQCLGLIQTEIMSRPVSQPMPNTMAAAPVPVAQIAPPAPVQAVASVAASVAAPVAAPVAIAAPAPVSVDDDRERKIGLGLLLKHRGGPGFGHGRLVGRELEKMEETLRAVAQKLVAEANQ